jgi:hypothetical protein
MTKRKSSKATKRKTLRRYLDGDISLSRCSVCGSTERTKYFRKYTHELPAHWFQGGLPATHVVYRFTRCKCGQYRRDRQFENRV